jgi:hypothetical protein
MQGFLRGLKHLALIAMIARALLPAGWMPSASAATPFVICTIGGPLQHAPDNGHAPAADHHGVCPFAAGPHLAATPDVPRIVQPETYAQAAQADRIYVAIVSARFAPGAARAPPLNA